MAPVPAGETPAAGTRRAGTSAAGEASVTSRARPGVPRALNPAPGRGNGLAELRKAGYSHSMVPGGLLVTS
jgi:hypothetical protein